MIVLNARFSKQKLQKLKGTTLRNMKYDKDRSTDHNIINCKHNNPLVSLFSILSKITYNYIIGIFFFILNWL